LASCQGKAARAEELAQAGIEAGRSGDLYRALASFDQALELDPANLKALYNGGISLMGAGRGAEAAGRFTRFLELRPGDALGHFYLGRASLQAGRKEEAVAALQRAVALGFADWVEWKAASDLSALVGDFRFTQLDLVVAQRAGEKFEAAAPGEGYGGRPLPHAPFPAFQRQRACGAGSAILDGGPPAAGEDLHACE
jgi:tetratricopeptide (TPR) repeat protein